MPTNPAPEPLSAEELARLEAVVGTEDAWAHAVENFERLLATITQERTRGLLEAARIVESMKPPPLKVGEVGLLDRASYCAGLNDAAEMLRACAKSGARVEDGAAQERARIVAWLRDDGGTYDNAYANLIESTAHLAPEPGKEPEDD